MEVTSTSIAAGVVSACAFQMGASVVDPVLGLAVDALIVGGASCIAVQLHIPPSGQRSILRVLGFALVASFFAGLFSPLLAGLLITYLNCPAWLSYTHARLSSAAVIGAVVHLGIPLLPALISKWSGAKP